MAIGTHPKTFGPSEFVETPKGIDAQGKPFDFGKLFDLLIEARNSNDEEALQEAIDAIMAAVFAADRGRDAQQIEANDKHRRTIRKLRKAKTVEDVRVVMRGSK